MKLENIEDLLTMDTDSNKADANKKLLRKVKQLLKTGAKKEENSQVLAESLPFTAVSVVGTQLVTVKFNLDTKEAIVDNVEVDERDTAKSNHMATYRSRELLLKLSREQK